MKRLKRNKKKAKNKRKRGAVFLLSFQNKVKSFVNTYFNMQYLNAYKKNILEQFEHWSKCDNEQFYILLNKIAYWLIALLIVQSINNNINLISLISGQKFHCLLR